MPPEGALERELHLFYKEKLEFVIFEDSFDFKTRVLIKIMLQLL
jgi:hypothetical protein